MVTKINSLKELPYSNYEGFLIKDENNTEFVKDSIAYLFISKHPKCIFLFVEKPIVNNNE